MGTQIPGHIGLLVDTGTVQNLTGQGFIDAAPHNMKKFIYAEPLWIKLDTPKSISGVGNDGTNCYKAARIAGATANGDILKYQAPVIHSTSVQDKSYDTQGLYGLHDMRASNVYVGTRRDVLVRVPEGQEQNIVWPAGTEFRTVTVGTYDFGYVSLEYIC